MNAKRIVVEVTLDQDENGVRTFHISRPGHAGLCGDDYGTPEVPHSLMAKDLGKDLVDLLGKVRQ